MQSRRHLELCRELFPWRTQLSSNGPFVGALIDTDVGEYLELCLTDLDDIERHVANGEVLGISLLIEDIIEQEIKDETGADHPDENPLRLHGLIRSFLITSIRLEQLKQEWCVRTLGFNINSKQRYKSFKAAYEAQIVGAVVKRCREQMKYVGGNEDGDAEPGRQQQRSTAGLLVGHGTALQLHGIPESEYRERLVDELISSLECMSISSVRASVRSAQIAVIQELSRLDTGTLR